MIYVILFFVLGVVLGSFYNVVGFRLSNGESIVKPRSHCPKCGHVLSFYELVPILSYLFLRGKCKCCKEKISMFYPIMELFSGILFAVSYYSFGFSYDLLLSIALSSLFIIVTVSDLNYYIIPDQVNLFFGIVIFVINILKFGFLGACKYAFFGLIIFLLMYLIMIIGKLIFKEECLGGGDVKLLFVLGMTCPLVLSLFGIALSSFIALPVSLIIYISNKDKKIPFGPFLVGGFLIILLFKIDTKKVFDFLMNL